MQSARVGGWRLPENEKRGGKMEKGERENDTFI